jgi:5-formyltetrahydrofolate cyclo-ligase
MRALRATLDLRQAAAAIAAHILNHLPIPAGTAVAGVWPLPDEMDLRPLWHALHQRGHPILLPQTPSRGQPLIFRLWQPNATMIPERFGTHHPDGPVGTPSLIFVPLLAFDAAGHRLGYGGGYYDRTLATHPAAQPIGYAHAAQQVPVIPTEPHDHPLPTIITDQAILACASGPCVPTPAPACL